MQEFDNPSTNKVNKKAYQDADQQLSEVVNICHSCGAEVEIGSDFCGECGEITQFNKILNNKCPNCGEFIQGDYCGFCGSSLNGIKCPKCSKINYGDFCSECGTPLSKVALELISDSDENSINIISEEESKLIIKDLHSSLSQELKDESEKMKQRIILLREREYFSKREERVLKNSLIKYDIKNVSKSNIDYVKKYLIQKKNAQNDDDDKNMINIKAKKLSEMKNIEETRRIEEEKKENEKINGTWMLKADWGYCILKFIVEKDVIKGTTFLSCPIGENVNVILGKLNGDNISYKITGKTGKECSNHAIIKFSGRIDRNTLTLNGFVKYYYETEQGIFVKSE